MFTTENDPEWEGWEYDILDVISGHGEGLTLTIICNTKRLIVEIHPTKHGSDTDPTEREIDTVENSLIRRYDAAAEDGNEEKMDALDEEMLDIVFGIGKPLIAKLAPPVAIEDQLADLHSLLYPEPFYLRFATINGKGELFQQIEGTEPRVALHVLDVPLAPTIMDDDSALHRYSAKDIRVLEKTQAEGRIAKVLVDGQAMCFKKVGYDYFKMLEREYGFLSKIADSPRASSFRIPKLTGLVTSSDGGRVIGILEEYIPHGLGNLSTLRDVDTAVVSLERRKKWAFQIQITVDLLHEIGLIWGDGKPRNVLIHEETDDAWLIDFGGGWTDGWVDRELMETQEGDKQAVRRIFEFLAV